MYDIGAITKDQRQTCILNDHGGDQGERNRSTTPKRLEVIRMNYWRSIYEASIYDDNLIRKDCIGAHTVEATQRGVAIALKIWEISASVANGLRMTSAFSLIRSSID